MDLLVLIASFVVILIGSELFTNGFEWFGHKLELGEGAIGSVLAAVGTALPETMVPLIAIVFGGGIAASEVGVGAILGAPFMLSTLTMFVTGSAVLILSRRRSKGTTVAISPGVLGHDMAYFAVTYSIAVGTAFLPVEYEWPRRLVALLLIGMYSYYVWGYLKADAEVHETLEPLRFHKLDRGAPQHPAPPRFVIVTVQVLFALACIIGGAWGFVQSVTSLAGSLGVNGTLLALLIAPIATELPEKLNSVLWISKGKDTLALGNVTGAMVFQSAIPTSVGLLLAPALWSVGGEGLAFASAGIALASSAAIFIPMFLRQRLGAWALMRGGAFYLVYLVFVLAALAHVA